MDLNPVDIEWQMCVPVLFLVMMRLCYSDHDAVSRRLRGSFTFEAITVVSAAILLYDYTLTVSDEIGRYWTLPIKWPTVLFFVNRYLAIPAQILALAPILFPLDARVKHHPTLQPNANLTRSYMAVSEVSAFESSFTKGQS